MTSTTIPNSAVDQVVKLKPGQVFSKSVVVPVPTPHEIQRARKALLNYLSTLIMRARKATKDLEFKINTTASVSTEYAVIVTGVIQVEDNSI